MPPAYKLLNLTAKEIVIHDEQQEVMVTLPSDGELRTMSNIAQHYPMHHIHYYNEETNVEVGIPIFSSIPVLDTKSPGYILLHDSKQRKDGVIVSSSVANALRSQNMRTSIDIFTIDRNSFSVVHGPNWEETRIKGLEWTG